MGTNSTLLCIHRDPSQLDFLQENGYDLLTATNGHDGLRLFMSRPVDAIVLEYHLGLLSGSVVATEIKGVKPQVPIVMLGDDAELPDEALKSVDAMVARSDGPQFLLATVHYVLRVKPARRHEADPGFRPPPFRSRHGRLPDRRSGFTFQPAVDDKERPFSLRVWRSIRNGDVQF